MLAEEEKEGRNIHLTGFCQICIFFTKKSGSFKVSKTGNPPYTENNAATTASTRTPAEWQSPKAKEVNSSSGTRVPYQLYKITPKILCSNVLVKANEGDMEETNHL